MTDWLIQNESTVRFSVFLSVLLGMALCEYYRPARAQSVSRWLRWRANLLLMLVNTLALRFALPVAAVSSAIWAASHNVGLFNSLDLPPLISVAVCIILLDGIIYFQHRLMHQIPVLWRLHKVHHADLDIDVTTAMRFHTLEMMLSMLIKCAVVILLGVPIAAVIVFEVILNASAMFNHSNISLVKRWDDVLRKLVVTPDMHRVHHSTVKAEQSTNYGFFLSVWDQLFNTHCYKTLDEQMGMQIGLKGERETESVARLKGLLMMPFKRV